MFFLYFLVTFVHFSNLFFFFIFIFTIIMHTILLVITLNRFKKFLLNSLLVTASSLILQIIKLLFNIYISNKVSSEALGVFGLIMATYYFGITLASSGINISCMRVVSEEFALGNDYGVRKTSKKSIVLSIIFSLFASFCFYINSERIVSVFFHSKVSTNIVNLICYALPLISISSAITGYFTAVRRVYKTVIGQFLEQISKIVAIVLLFKFQTTSSLESICFSLILGDLISEIISFVYLVIAYITDINYHFSTLKASSISNFTHRICRILFPVAFTSCIKSGIYTFKQLIIPSSFEKNGKNCSEALSEYGIISGMAMPVVMFPATFLITAAALLIPEFSRYYIKRDYKKIKIYTDKLIVYSFIFSLFLTFLLCTFGNKLGLLIYHNSDARKIYSAFFFAYSFYVCGHYY